MPYWKLNDTVLIFSPLYVNRLSLDKYLRVEWYTVAVTETVSGFVNVLLL